MSIGAVDYNLRFGGLTSGYGNTSGIGGNQQKFPQENVSGVDHGLFTRSSGQVQGTDGGNSGLGLIDRIGKINGELSPVMKDEFRGNRLDLMC